MRTNRIRLIGLSVIFGVICCGTTWGQEEEQTRVVLPDEPMGLGWSGFAWGGVSHQFDTDLDGGGRFSVSRFFIQGGPSYTFSEGHQVSVAVGYGFDDYNFSGNTGIAGMNPWSGVHTVRLSVPTRWQLDDDIELFVIPTVRWTVENGGKFSKAMTGGGFAGASFEVSDTLKIGPGIGVLTELEDSIIVFPILVIDWKIADKLKLSTGPAIGATLGPGLALTYQVNEAVEVSIGGRYEQLRFRLDKNGTTPDGIGEESDLTLYGGGVFALSRKSGIAVIGGVKLGGELELADKNGNTITKEDYDPALFVGLLFKVVF